MIFTQPSELKKFHALLMSNAPKGYEPHYFPAGSGKEPDFNAIKRRAPKGTPKKLLTSWKAPHARLTFKEAVKREEEGLNVALGAMKEDALVVIDNDVPTKDLLKTLRVISRKRIGFHSFCWANHEDDKLPCNIPTGKGEVRASDQYVIAAGSYVEPTEKELCVMVKEGKITEEEKQKILSDPNRGVYTVANDEKPLTIKYDDLPLMFRERDEEVAKKEEEIADLRKKQKPMKKHNGRGSALFSLTIHDVVPYPPGRRDPHPLHPSDTGKNFSVSSGVAQCWRHNVSLNPIQYLVVESGYMCCENAGTGHRGSNAGCSQVIGDDGAVFHAWLQAKRRGLIPQNDAVPISAMLYVARKHEVCDESLIPRRWELPNKQLTTSAYNEVLKIIEEVY